jgi:hypothetical protein
MLFLGSACRRATGSARLREKDEFVARLFVFFFFFPCDKKLTQKRESQTKKFLTDILIDNKNDDDN